MALLQYTSKEKLAIACKRWQKVMEYLAPADTPIAGWVDAIAQEHGVGVNGDEIFENVYRCYHASYKVCWMQTNPMYFIDMLVYLFNSEIDHTFEMNDNALGFPGVFEKTFCYEKDACNERRYLAQLHNVIMSDSRTYRYVSDILQREPISSGWQVWEPHHIALMGGTFWMLIASTSLLGILKWEAEYQESAPIGGLISYPEGVANYIGSEINIQGINNSGPAVEGGAIPAERPHRQQNIDVWTENLVAGGVRLLQKTLPDAGIAVIASRMLQSCAEVRAQLSVKEGDVISECELRCAYSEFTIRFPALEKSIPRDYSMDYVGRQGSMAAVVQTARAQGEKNNDWMGI